MAAGQEFWIVATAAAQEAQKDDLYQQLSNHASVRRRGASGEEGPWKLQVPDGERSLMFGSFDNLIRLTDELAKNDAQVDSIVHRLERQWLEIDPKLTFKVKAQRQERSFIEYISTWQWDEAKYPRTRSIADNLTHLMQTVNKIDEEARNKTLLYNESRTQKANLSSKEGVNLMAKDLVDVLTPEVMKIKGENEAVNTEHLATVFVILSRGTDKEFQNAYESFSDLVVPRSAKKYQGLDDKDGNSIWRVVMFKSCVEDFKKACREKRFQPRDFEYSEDGYKKLVTQREQVQDALTRQHGNIKGLYNAAWSDVMVAWIHIKAMRVFVESVLRFGMPPKFAAYTIVQKGNPAHTRKALADILGKQAKDGMVGAAGDAGGEEGEEYFPYVSFSFTPFVTPR